MIAIIFPAMAEEAFEIPVTMEKIEPRECSWRRNSTGNINTKISVVLPRYLSAPFASCHDSCKYGSKRSSSNDEAAAARTHLRKRFASKLQKKPVSEEEHVDNMQMEKKFAGSVKLPSNPRKQKGQDQVLGHDSVKRGVVPVSARQHQSSSKTKGISRSSQKGSSSSRSSTVQSSEDRETRTKHGNSRIPRRTLSQQNQRHTKQDSAENEEHVPEKTLVVIKEHKEDSTNHNDSSCCLEEEKELNSEQENASNLPRKLLLRSRKMYEDGAISPRKLVDVFGNVKPLIDVFESVISRRDGSSSPAAGENMFTNVKALIGVFERVISQKLLAPNRVTSDTSLIDSTN